MSTITKLKTALEELEEENVLIPYGSRLDNLLNKCIDLLRENNYTVKSNPKAYTIIRNNKDLVNYYYKLLERLYPSLIPYRNYTADLKIAKNLVEKIKLDYGYEYEDALSMCISIVDMVFKYRKEFNFDPTKVISFGIFGQSGMAWVTEKAIKLINKEKFDLKRLEREADIKTERYEDLNNIDFGYDNLDGILNGIRKGGK